MNKKTTDSLTLMSKNKNIDPLEIHQSTKSQQFGFNNSYKRNQVNNNNNNSAQQHTTLTTVENEYSNSVPKAPYQCYKCGASDHFIRNCPHFQ